MDKNVAKTGDLAPLDMGLLLRYLFRKLLDGFTNDFEVANDSVEPQFVRCKTLLIEPGDVCVDSPDRFKDVLEIDPRITRHRGPRGECGRAGQA